MTKAPQAGISKTRLIPPLTSVEAARLSACFLRDTSQNIAALGPECHADGIAVYTPVGAEVVYEGLLHKSFRLLAQRGTLFGERLFHAAEDLLAVGYESCCLVDSDSPDLPPAFLKDAVSALARPGDRVVLGPANDGGYYLIGLKKAHQQLFTAIDWSTPKVLVQTIARATEAKLEVVTLPAWYDIDEAADLRQLCGALFSNNGKHREHFGTAAYAAPHTRRYLSQLIERRGGIYAFRETSAALNKGSQHELANRA